MWASLMKLMDRPGGAPSKAFTPSRGSWAECLARLPYLRLDRGRAGVLAGFDPHTVVRCRGLSWRKAVLEACYCPLPVAATRVYSALKNSTGVGAFSARVWRQSEHVLNEVATAIAQEVPIFGKQAPSTNLERLPERIFPQGGIVDGGRRFRRHGLQATVYADLTVRRVDVGRAIRAIRKNWAVARKK